MVMGVMTYRYKCIYMDFMYVLFIDRLLFCMLIKLFREPDYRYL